MQSFAIFVSLNKLLNKSNPEGYGWNDLYQTHKKHNKMRNMCVILGVYSIFVGPFCDYTWGKCNFLLFQITFCTRGCGCAYHQGYWYCYVTSRHQQIHRVSNLGWWYTKETRARALTNSTKGSQNGWAVTVIYQRRRFCTCSNKPRSLWFHAHLRFIVPCLLGCSITPFLADPSAFTTMPWFLKVDWLLYNVATAINIMVSLSYWTLLYAGKGRPVTCWRQQMETFSALLALCAGNSPVTGESPSQRLMTRSFDVFCEQTVD